MMGITAKERCVVILVVFAIISCLFTFTAHDALGMGRYGDQGMDGIIRKHLPWHRKNISDLTNLY